MCGVRVLVVDDSEAVQASFGSLLASVPNVELIVYADDVSSALVMIEAHAPDLIVMDIDLRHGEHGVEALRHVMRARPSAEVIVLSNFMWKAVRSQLLAAGAAAHFDKANEFLLARDWIAARAAVTASADLGHEP